MNGPRHGHSFVKSQGMYTNFVAPFVQGILAVATWVGRADVERHIGKDMHKVNVKSAHSQRKLQFVSASDPINDKVYKITIFHNI